VLPATSTRGHLQGGHELDRLDGDVDYAAFDPGIASPTPRSPSFFGQPFRYTIAPRVGGLHRVSAEALAQVAPPTDAEVREFYDANPGKFPKAGRAKAPGGKA
jgi:peptidyl-prolyl cis-trans isomerase D